MSRRHAEAALAATALSEVKVRALGSADEYAACVRLQQETWGMGYVDCVPASLLKVTQLLGGVCAGAVAADGRLIGFVFGLTGLRDGRLVHWSHMLAVLPEYRDCGVGRRLKEYQREVVRAQGIEEICWTFDPLVARNAHLNLNRLGTEVREYVPDMYGSTGSKLHEFGTDRFVVGWPVASIARVALPVPASWRGAPVAGGIAHGRDQQGADGVTGAPVVRVEIPSDIEALALDQARAWRRSTRRAFAGLMADGYFVRGFYTEDGPRCFYVLETPAVVAHQC